MTGKSRILNERTEGVNSVTFSPDGSTLASGSNDGTVRLWDAVNGELLNTIQFNDDVQSIAFRPQLVVLM
jgi:WD40 repeat protein